jgi:HK97 family phage prohead protease
MMRKPESRCLSGEIRAETVDGHLRAVGYAAVFNALSEDLGGFREVIRPGAFAASLAGADVRALINHDKNLVLGRTKSGTLLLQEDSRGLRYEIDLPDTQYARDLAVILERRDISGSSFRFYMHDDPQRGQTWRSEPGGVVREITEFRAIDDVSVVTYPAYPQTESALRDLDSFRRSQPRRKALGLSVGVRLRLAEAE